MPSKSKVPPQLRGPLVQVFELGGDCVEAFGFHEGRDYSGPRVSGDRFAAFGLVDALGGGGVPGEFLGRAPRARNQLAAAVRAFAAQDVRLEPDEYASWLAVASDDDILRFSLSQKARQAVFDPSLYCGLAVPARRSIQLANQAIDGN